MASDHESGNDFNRIMGKADADFKISPFQKEALNMLLQDCKHAEGIIVAQTTMVVDVLKRDRQRVQEAFSMAGD